MTDRKPIVENDGEFENQQPGDKLDTTLTNERLPQKTGIIRGWIPSIGTLTTQITITSGVGFLVDNETNPENPLAVKQVGGPFTDVAILDIGFEVFTFFWIDDDGTILQQQHTFPTRAERRFKNFVAAAYHPAGEAIAVYPIGIPAFEGDFFAHDILLEEGVKFLGNVYEQATAGTPDPLNLKVSSGFIGYAYANRKDTIASRQDPHFAPQVAVDPVVWTYVVNDGADAPSIVSSAITLVDTLNKSDGIGGITPLTNNRSGIVIIFRDALGNTVIEYTIADFRPTDTTTREALIAALQSSKLTLTVPFVPIYALEYPKSATTLADCTFHRLLGLSVGGSPGTGVIGTDFSLLINSPHAVGVRTSSLFVPSVARTVVDLLVQAGAVTSAGSDFTFELFHGATLATATNSLGVVTVTGGTERGTLVLGSPIVVPANDIFVANTTVIGAFPIATEVRHKRFYFHVRTTPG